MTPRERSFATEPQVLLVQDRNDALRVIEAAATIAAIPGLMSPESRALAARRLREMASAHPRSAEIFAAVVQHLESFS